MFKFAGCMLIILSSVMIFSTKVLESYFTYRFLMKGESIAEKLMCEKGTNLSYEKLFEKIGFEKNKYYLTAEENRYINRKEYLSVRDFLDNLGKRDADSEYKYIEINLKNIKRQKDMYYKTYCEDRKIYMLSGAATGVFISIILI